MARISSPPTDRMLLLLAEMTEKRLCYLTRMDTTGNRIIGGFVSLATGKRVNIESLNAHVGFKELDGLDAREFLCHIDKKKLDNKLKELNPERAADTGMPDNSMLSWYENPSMVSKEGLEAIEKYRDRLEVLRAEISRTEDEPRYLASKRMKTVFNGFSYSTTKVEDGVGELYVITGETAKRYTIKPAYTHSESDPATGGHRASLYIEKSNVLYTDISPSTFAKMKEATLEHHARLASAKAQADSEIEELLAPIRQRLAARQLQLGAQLIDELTEISSSSEEDSVPNDGVAPQP